MNKIWKILIVVALVIATLGVFTPVGQSAVQTLGGMTGYSGITITPQDSTDGLVVGSSGSTVKGIYKGTCNLVGGSVAATSSAAADCAVTGVVAGDLVFAAFATTTTNGVITSARASSTSGFITVQILNLQGSAKDTTVFGTSTEYLVIH